MQGQVGQAEPTATHRSLQEDMAMTTAELIGAHKIVAEEGRSENL